MVIRYSTEELYEIGRTVNIKSNIEEWIANHVLQQQQKLADPVAEFFRKAQLNFHTQTSGIDPTKVRRLSEVEAELIGNRNFY